MHGIKATSRRLQLIKTLHTLGLSLKSKDRRGNDVVYHVLADACGSTTLREDDLRYLEAILKVYVEQENQCDELRQTAMRLSRLMSNKLRDIISLYTNLVEGS